MQNYIALKPQPRIHSEELKISKISLFFFLKYIIKENVKKNRSTANFTTNSSKSQYYPSAWTPFGYQKRTKIFILIIINTGHLSALQQTKHMEHSYYRGCVFSKHKRSKENRRLQLLQGSNCFSLKHLKFFKEENPKNNNFGLTINKSCFKSDRYLQLLR